MTQESNQIDTPEIDHSWLQLLYEEAWRQYDHEDNISQNRNNLFLGVETALLATLAGISAIAFQPDNFSFLQLVLIGHGLFSIGLGTFGISIASNWDRANKAGRAYLNIRWVTARAIEAKANLSSFGLAIRQDDWRKYSENLGSNTKQGDRYYPFKEEAELEDLKELSIPLRVQIGGWGSTEKLIGNFKALWILLIIFAIIEIGLGIFLLIQP